MITIINITNISALSHIYVIFMLCIPPRLPHPSSPCPPTVIQNEVKNPPYVVLRAWERDPMPPLCKGERVRYADSPCGASAYAQTKKSPYQGRFRARKRHSPWCRQDGDTAQAVTEGLTRCDADKHNNPPASQARHRLTQVDLALGQQFCVHMQNCQLMRARTPHRGDAHDARIRPLHREGMAPSVRELSPKVTEGVPP